MAFSTGYALLFGLAGFSAGAYRLRNGSSARQAPLIAFIACVGFTAASYNIAYAMLTGIEFAIGLGIAYLFIPEVKSSDSDCPGSSAWHSPDLSSGRKEPALKATGSPVTLSSSTSTEPLVGPAGESSTGHQARRQRSSPFAAGGGVSSGLAHQRTQHDGQGHQPADQAGTIPHLVSAAQGQAPAPEVPHKAAAQGDAGAQAILGAMYVIGHGVERDYEKAVSWLRKAAAQGSKEGQTGLAALYAQGLGVEPDFAEALRWYRKAADQGYSVAQRDLGNMYLEGQGVLQDDQQAVLWWRKAAEQGDAAAQYALGASYSQGRGSPRSDQQAAHWFRKAASQGHRTAQYQLGNMCLEGRGTQQDDQQSVFWWRKAADQRDAMAQYALAVSYSQGRGVSKDEQQAAHWFLRAATQGHKGAQFNFGGMCGQGEGGLTEDLEETYFWWLLAAEQGLERAQEGLPTLAAILTPIQRARAQAAADEWCPTVCN
jgi:TPR repeat protein